MNLGKVVPLERVHREFVVHRNKGLVRTIEIKPIVKVRFPNVNQRRIVTRPRVKVRRDGGRELGGRDGEQVVGTKSVEAVLLDLGEELSERVVALEDEAAAVGRDVDDELGLARGFGAREEELDGALELARNVWALVVLGVGFQSQFLPLAS